MPSARMVGRTARSAADALVGLLEQRYRHPAMRKQAEGGAAP
jgi:hypothetical protein